MMKPLIYSSYNLLRVKTNSILLVILACVLLYFSAKTSIYIYTIPFTLQTLAVLFIGITLKRNLAFIAVITYIFEGILGLPVFSSVFGPLIVLSPNFGFILGFIPAVIIASFAKSKNHFLNILILIASAQVVLLSGFLYNAMFIGFAKSFSLSYVPFVYAEVIKSLFAGSLLTSYKALTK